MKDDLRAEAPGILAWLRVGCGRWVRNGLPTPCTINDATAAYRLASDPTATFVAECCERNPRSTVVFLNFYRALESWCEQVGTDVPSRRAAGQSLQREGFEPQDGTGGRREYRGVRIRP